MFMMCVCVVSHSNVVYDPFALACVTPFRWRLCVCVMLLVNQNHHRRMPHRMAAIKHFRLSVLTGCVRETEIAILVWWVVVVVGATQLLVKVHTCVERDTHSLVD